MIERSFFCILSADLAVSAAWYRGLFGYETQFESDWFIHLSDAVNGSIELGIVDRNHEIVPEAHRSQPVGGMLTLVVADTDDLHAAALQQDAEIVEEPRDLFYGQRRMLLRDPDGQLVDVSSECEPDPEWLAGLSG